MFFVLRLRFSRLGYDFLGADEIKYARHRVGRVVAIAGVAGIPQYFRILHTGQ